MRCRCPANETRARSAKLAAPTVAHPALASRRIRRAACPGRNSGEAADDESTRQAIRAFAASVLACGFALQAASPALADETTWKPRRHHRHIGERFTDTWADAIVEREEANIEEIRELQRQLRAEKKRADEESGKRREAEARLRAYIVEQRAAASRHDDDTPVSIRLLGADITGPLLFAALAGGSYWAYNTGALARWTGGRLGGRRRGRWVYDRSMGGRKVWVPADVPGTSDLPPAMSESDFAELTAVAAHKVVAAEAAAAPYQPPTWWRAPPSFPPAASQKAELQGEASRLMSRLEQAKNRGEDYSLEDILALRKTCRLGGGITVEARTVGGRDAIFRAGVEGAMRSLMEPGGVDLGGEEPLGLVAGLAGDLKIPDERGVQMVTNWVTGACRNRIVEAITALKQGEETEALMALVKLSALLEGLPGVLRADSPNADLIADELKTWAALNLRRNVLVLSCQISVGTGAVVGAMLGVDPSEVAQDLQGVELQQKMEQ